MYVKIEKVEFVVILALIVILGVCCFRIGYIDANKIKGLEEQVEVLNKENINLDKENMDLIMDSLNRYDFEGRY